VPAANETSAEWAVELWWCFPASISRDICLPRSTQADLHMCPTFLPPGHNVLYSWLHCMLMAGKLRVSSFASIVLRDIPGLTAAGTQAGSRLRSLQSTFSQPIDFNVNFPVRVRVPNKTRCSLPSSIRTTAEVTFPPVSSVWWLPAILSCFQKFGVSKPFFRIPWRTLRGTSAACAHFNICFNVSCPVCRFLETLSKRGLHTHGSQTLHLAQFPRRPR
jgi:hypothetical protein